MLDGTTGGQDDDETGNDGFFQDPFNPGSQEPTNDNSDLPTTTLPTTTTEEDQQQQQQQQEPSSSPSSPSLRSVAVDGSTLTVSFFPVDDADSYQAVAVTPGSNPNSGSGYSSSQGGSNTSQLFISGVAPGSYDVYVGASNSAGTTWSGSSTASVEGSNSDDNSSSSDGLTIGSSDVDTQAQFATGGSQGEGEDEGEGSGDEEPPAINTSTTDNEEPSTTTTDQTSTDGEGETVESGLQQLSNLSSTEVASELTSDENLKQLLTAGEDDTPVNTEAVAAVEDSVENDEEETAVSKLGQFIERGANEKDLTTAFLGGLAKGKADKFAKSYALLCVKFFKNREPTKAVVVVKSVAVSIVFCFQKGYYDTGYKAIDAFTSAVSQSSDCVVIIKQITQVFINIIVTPYGCGFKGCYTKWF
jgi:hypothetical protein